MNDPCRTPIVVFVVLGLASIPAGLVAGSGLPQILPSDLETQLALSAAPGHLRDGVSLYLLGEEGYRLERQGNNGFSCLVVRGPGLGAPAWDDAISGWCFDPYAMDTVGKTLMDRARYRRQGLNPEDTRNEINAGFASGKYRAPDHFGVIYMLGPVNKVPDHRNGELYDFPPHVMYLAPNTTNDDIGIPKSVHTGDPTYVWSGLPFIPNAGPHGFVVQRLGEKESAAIYEEYRELIDRVRRYVDYDPPGG